MFSERRNEAKTAVQLREVVFISHANPDDNDFTKWLGARLASAGYKVWSDLTQLIGGEIFWKDIEEAIRHHSVKFLSVLSPASLRKRGCMKELSVADAIESSGDLGDFIIPLRLRDIAYLDIPIQIHYKNVIDFTEGWHLGLVRLLKKLEKDNVPRQEREVESALSDWARSFLHFGEGVAREDEQVMSNWLPIEELPATIRICSFSLTPKTIAPLQSQWPCRLVGWRVVSFARAQDFDPPPEMSSLRNEGEIDTMTFLNTGSSSLPALSYQDRANILTDLLRQGWEQYAKAKGFQGFAMASGGLCWYIPKSESKIEQVRFNDVLGKSGRRALIGESKKLKAFWHFGLEFMPSVGKKCRYTLLTHVIFTSEGETPIGDSRRMHRLRRSFCRQWWQDRWRDLISAFLAELSKDEPWFSIPVAPGLAITVGTAPLTYTSPVRTIQKVDAKSVEEALDDADLLYDASLEDDEDDNSDEEPGEAE